MKQMTIWHVVLVALFLVLLLPMINVAYEGSAEESVAENESIVVDYDADVFVEEADTAFAFDETVEINNSAGDSLEDGTDYTWNSSTGAVSWQNTSATTEGEEASISYVYSEQTETSSNIAAIIQPLAVPLGWLLMMACVGAVFYYGFGRGGGW